MRQATPPPADLRIGLNLLYLRPGVTGGGETYARGLLDGLAGVATTERFAVFVTEDAADWPIPDGFTRVVCPTRATPQARRYAYEQLRLPGRVRTLGLDVLHSLGNVSPLRAPCRRVVTVHDLNYRAPAHAMPLVRRSVLRLMVGASIRRSDAVITVSAFVRDEISAAMPTQRAKLHVVHEAATLGGAAAARHEGRPVEGPYFMAFSSVSPNKNLPRLLQAFTAARNEYDVSHQLILVGHRPPDAMDTPGVIWRGYLPDHQVEHILRHADALFFPSLYEGFGLPLLEAMTVGTAVACSNRASLPEIAGDAALYFDPLDVDEIASAMRDLGRDGALRRALIARGRERASRFSWTRAAEETLAVYRAAMGEPASPVEGIASSSAQRS